MPGGYSTSSLTSSAENLSINSQSLGSRSSVLKPKSPRRPSLTPFIAKKAFQKKAIVKDAVVKDTWQLAACSDTCEIFQDLTVENSAYQAELIEGPKYLNQKVVPRILEVIQELIKQVKQGHEIADPLHFIATHLNPDRDFSLLLSKPDTAIAPVVEEPSVIEPNQEEEIPQDFLEEGLTEKEYRIKKLFSGEFY